MLIDGGAYASTSVEVTKVAAVFASGCYEIPNISVDSYVVYTNNFPCGAFRGFGAPQGHFASEVQMNLMAEAIGMDPWEIRFINAWRDGDTGPTQWKVVAAGLIETMKKTAEMGGIQLPDHLMAMSSQRR